MFGLKHQIEVGEALRHPCLQVHPLTTSFFTSHLTSPSRLTPTRWAYHRTPQPILLPLWQWCAHAKRRAQRSVPCPSSPQLPIWCPWNSTNIWGHDTSLRPWHSFPPQNFVFIIDTIICRSFFIHLCSYISRFVLMYWHIIPIITLILWVPRGVHEAPPCDQIMDIPPLCFCAPSLLRSSFPIQPLKQWTYLFVTWACLAL